MLDALEATLDERRWPADLRTEVQTLPPNRPVLQLGLLFRRITDDETTQ